MIIKKITDFIFGKIIPNKTVKKSKENWEKLANENAKYYICSDLKKQEESQFRLSGKEDFERLIANDSFLTERLDKINADSVLEIGCGIGRITEFLSACFNKVYAVDISGKMIEGFKNRLSGLGNIEAIETDGQSIPFKDKSVDFAFSFIVFQHMPAKEIVASNFKEVFRILKEKGIFKVQLRGLKAPKKEWYYGVDYGLEEAIKLSENAGFKVLKYEGEGSKYFWLWLEKSARENI